MSFNELICRQIEKDKGLDHLSLSPVTMFSEFTLMRSLFQEHSGELEDKFETVSIKDMDEVIFKGKCILVNPAYAVEEAYFSPVITDLNIKDVQEHADKGVAFSGSEHHRYLETLREIHPSTLSKYLELIESSKDISKIDGITVFEMELGS